MCTGLPEANKVWLTEVLHVDWLETVDGGFSTGVCPPVAICGSKAVKFGHLLMIVCCIAI